ncbi:MAG: LPS export ABC transporter permease LptF [Pseudomonadota bacterium]
MGKFDRYVLSRLMLTFGFFSLVLVGVYWVNRAVILLDQYVSQGQGGTLVFELTLLSLPSLMLIVLPIAAVVAAIYATNRLYVDSELVVVQATGFSVWRLSRPFVIFGSFVAAVMLVLANVLVPASMVKLNGLEEELAQAISSRILTPGTFETPARGVTFYVRDITPDGTLENLMMLDRREGDRETTYTAERALLVRDPEGPKLIMFDGMAQSMDLDTRRLSVTEFTDFTVAIDSLIDPQGRSRLDPRQVSTLALLRPTVALEEETRRSAARLKREAHLRIAQPLLAIPASLVGFAALMLGGFSRFGLWRQIVLAVLLVILVKLLDNAAIDAARRNEAMWPLIYLSFVVSSLGCGFLLWLGDSGRLSRRRRRAA